MSSLESNNPVEGLAKGDSKHATDQVNSEHGDLVASLAQALSKQRVNIDLASKIQAALPQPTAFTAAEALRSTMGEIRLKSAIAQWNQGLVAHVADILGPFNGISRAITEALPQSAIFQAADALRHATRETAQLNSAMAQWNRDLAARVAEALSPVQALSRTMASFAKLDIGRGIATQVAQANFARSAFTEAFRSSEMLSGISAFKQRLQIDPAFLSALTEQIKNELRETDRLPLEPQPPPSEAVVLLEQVLEEVNLTSSMPAHEAVTKLTSVLSYLAPDARGFIVNIIAGIILYYFLPAPAPQNLTVQQIVNSHRTAINNTIVISQAPHISRRYIRIVSHSGLPVFSSPRRNSARKDMLEPGQMVVIEVKKRNWCKVIYQMPGSTDIREGWVFTRYLSRL